MTTRTAYYIWLKPGLGIIASASISAGLAAAATLTLTSPPTAAPGTSLPVTVVPSGSFSQVVVVGEGRIGFSQVLTGAGPFQVSVPLPANLSPGSYALTAMGASAGALVSSAPVIVTVDRTDAPIQVDVLPTNLNLGMGDKVAMTVIGTYADGARLDITRSLNTKIVSDSPGVAALDSHEGVTVAAVGPGSGHIIVSNLLSNYSLQIPLSVSSVLGVAPMFPTLYAGQTSQFNVFQPGVTSSIPVSWSIQPQSGSNAIIGSINSSGVYKAPSSVTQQYLVFITATSKADPSKSVTTGVGIFPPVSISLSPSTPVILNAGQTFRFTPTISNALDSNLEWSITNKSPGSIDSTGLYTAPATVKSQQTVTVIATSIADSSKTATGTITLLP